MIQNMMMPSSKDASNKITKIRGCATSWKRKSGAGTYVCMSDAYIETPAIINYTTEDIDIIHIASSGVWSALSGASNDILISTVLIRQSFSKFWMISQVMIRDHTTGVESSDVTVTFSESSYQYFYNVAISNSDIYVIESADMYMTCYTFV